MCHHAKFPIYWSNLRWDTAIFIVQDGGRRHLGFSKCGNFRNGNCQEAEIHHRAKFCVDRSNRWWHTAILRFFKMAAVAILDFQNLTILGAGRLKRVKERHPAKFRSNQSNRYWDIAIFWFFSMAATGILDFQNGETLAVGRLKTAKMRHHARFNLSVKPALRYSHILLFKTAAAAIKMVAAAVLDFQNVGILGWDKSRWPKCVTLPNFAAICRTVAEI